MGGFLGGLARPLGPGDPCEPIAQRVEDTVGGLLVARGLVARLCRIVVAGFTEDFDPNAEPGTIAEEGAEAPAAAEASDDA